MINWGEITTRLDPTSFRDITVFNSKVYNMVKLGAIVDINPSINYYNLKDNEEISFIPMEDIDENLGSVTAKKIKLLKENKGFTKFQEGDLLWAKITPCMQNGKSAIASGLVSGYGCGSTEFFVLRPKGGDLLIKYIHFILRDERILQNAQNFFGGSAGQQRVSKDYIINLPLPLPPLSVQQHIIDIMEKAYTEKAEKEKEAKELLEGINDYLLTELGIEMPIEDENSLENRMFYVSSNDVIGGRFDPRKYTTKYQQIFQSISNSPYPKHQLRKLILNDVSGNWGLDETEEDDNLIKCLTIRATEFDNRYNLNLSNNRVKYRKYNKAVFEKIELNENDILVEKSGGSEEQPVGRVAIIINEMLTKYNLAYSNFIHKLEVNTQIVDAQYLFEYLRLMHNVKVTEVMQTQTNGIRNLIMGEYFRQFIILPDLQTQTIIANTAMNMRLQSKQLEDKANKIIEDAKQLVEKILLEGSL